MDKSFHTMLLMLMVPSFLPVIVILCFTMQCIVSGVHELNFVYDEKLKII